MKKKKINEKKLAFSKETVAHLNASKLNGINGGNAAGKPAGDNQSKVGSRSDENTMETVGNGQ